MRAPNSAAPPGGNGTISRIGLLGYCAAAAVEISAAIKAATILVMAPLRLYAGRTQRAAVAFHLLLHERGQVFGRRRAEREGLALHGRLHVRALHRIAELLVDALHDLARHLRGAEEPGPGGDREL